MSGAAFGVDLGGTKTEGVALGADGGEILRLRVPTVPGSYDATIATIAGLVDRLERGSGRKCRRLGLGVPGSPAPDSGLIRNANSTWINGRPLARDLEAALGRPVRIANDANCLALSEMRDGVAARAASLFAVILGTGVGGALAFGGRLVPGANGLGGEWGHVPQPGERRAGAACHCGRRGCVETWLSGPALLRRYRRRGGAGAAGAAEIALRAHAGDETARRVLAEHLDRLGRALAMIVNIADPAMIVLGGGVSRLPGLADALPAAIRPHVFAPAGDAIRLTVRLARWGDSSGVRGAARLWEEETT